VATRTLAMDAEIERFHEEILAAHARGQKVPANRNPPPGIPKEFAELISWTERRKTLGPLWASLRDSFMAGAGSDNPTDWLAVECIMALLEFLEHGPVEHPVVTSKQVKAAHKILASLTMRGDLILSTKIERAAQDGEQAGAEALRLIRSHGRPDGDVVDLVRMLRAHVSTRGKGGRHKAGSHTTAAIAAWLRNDEKARKSVTKAESKKRKRT
jgi:hypothetical protein